MDRKRELGDGERELPRILGSSRRKRKAVMRKDPVNCNKESDESQIEQAKNLIQNVPCQETEVEVKEETDEEVNIHAKEATTESHRCDKCSYCSDHGPKAKEEKKKRHECTECKYGGVRRTFATKHKLETHKESAHATTDPQLSFTCQECEVPVVYATKAKYMYHLGAKHPGVVQFVCEYCALVFKLKANYRAHLASHNVPPNKKFSCEVCKGTFVNRNVYQSHLRRFPGPHMKQICVHCGFSFSREKQMQNHRCKKLLLEEAEARLAAESAEESAATEISSESSPTAQMYRSVAMSVSEPVVIQELLDGDGDQIIIRDLTGQIVPSSHVLRFDLAEGVEPTEQLYQVNVADWNMVAPFVIRDSNCQQEPSS